MRLMILLALMVSTRNGDVYLREGAKAEARQDYESARQLYEYAVAENPNDAGYAAKLKAVEGKIPRVEKQVTPAVIMLQPVEQIIHALEMHHRTAQELYGEVARAAGIHVTFEAGIVDSPVENMGNLNESLLESALDWVAFSTHTSWKAVSSDTILVNRRTGPEPSRVVALEPVRHYTDLRAAIRAGAFADAVRAVVKGADLKDVDANNGRGVMHDVCAAGQADLIPLLAEFGADPMLQDRFGQTPLQVALEYENEKAVGALLALAGVHEQMMGVAAEAMENAAVGGNVEVLRLLLARGAKVDGRNSLTGATALMMAAEMGKVEPVRVLLQAGADRSLKDRAGRGALDRAREMGSGEMVELLSQPNY